MRVKVTFVRIPINVKESDPECLLALFESTAYYGPVFPPTYRLHIEEMDFAFRREGYKYQVRIRRRRRGQFPP